MELTIKQYPDFTRLPEPEFDHFLIDEHGAPKLLNDYQKEKRRNTPKEDRNKHFAETMAVLNLDEAIERQRLFQNYLIGNRIFMTEQLYKQFCGARDVLSTALHGYKIGKNNHQSDLIVSAHKEMSRVKEIINQVELAVQARLHYEDA